MLEGTQSNLFALALVLSLVVAYDATGVRLHAGRHASVLNIMIAGEAAKHVTDFFCVCADQLHACLQRNWLRQLLCSQELHQGTPQAAGMSVHVCRGTYAQLQLQSVLRWCSVL